MTVKIHDPQFPKYKIRRTQLMKAFGLKSTGDLPAEGLPPITIDGVTVFVRPRTPYDSRASHRMLAVCTCGKHVPVGRLHQHRCRNAEVV